MLEEGAMAKFTTKIRKSTLSLPEEAARELAVYAASRFTSHSQVIYEALVGAGIITRRAVFAEPREEREEGRRKESRERGKRS
jgi:hypothetical protein